MELESASKTKHKKKRSRSSSSESDDKKCESKKRLKESKHSKSGKEFSGFRDETGNKTEKRNKRKKRRKLKKKKNYSESETSNSSSQSEIEVHKRKKKRKKKKKLKIKERKKVKPTEELDLRGSDTNEGKEEYNVISGPIPEQSVEKPKRRPMAPMTQEEYQKQQSKVKRVFDPETGRERLVKGDGEIIEEVVSYDRHKAINKLSTMGDGATFQKSLGLNRYTDKIY